MSIGLGLGGLWCGLVVWVHGLVFLGRTGREVVDEGGGARGQCCWEAAYVV